MEDKVRSLRKDSLGVAASSSHPLVARVRACSEDGLLLDSGLTSLVVARMTKDVARVSSDELVGQEVLVLFEDGDADRPIAIAVLHSASNRSFLRAVVDDGEELVIDAKKKIRFQCGKGSITITSDGKIILRGTHLLSRSSGPLRIKGGHVEIN